MKTTTKKTRRKETAFTIIELLTVMSIIVILLGLLVPAMNKAKIYAKTVNQKNQFHSIDVALELFKIDYEDYPPSDQLDDAAIPAAYCGAMKLAEAVVGQDLMGFHPDSAFRYDLMDTTGTINLYAAPEYPAFTPDQQNIKSRKGPYLQVDRANAYKLENLWGMQPGAIGNFNNKFRFVLCDEYARATNRGAEGPSRIGMPVLYYKANISGFAHDSANPLNPQNIYDYTDNIDLINLKLPWDSTKLHWLDPSCSDSGVSGDTLFYNITKNPNIKILSGRPYRPDSYILISAGYDGVYGTEDDIFNFNK